MIATSHTAGPWIIRNRADTQSEYHTLFNCDVMPVAKSDYDYVGSICAIQSCDHINGISHGQAQANARLISAAPDLLRAAVAALTIVAREQPDGSIMADLLAAIAKAEGKEVSYQPARIPGDAGPCPADMDDSQWLARNNID